MNSRGQYGSSAFLMRSSTTRDRWEALRTVPAYQNAEKRAKWMGGKKRKADGDEAQGVGKSVRLATGRHTNKLFKKQAAVNKARAQAGKQLDKQMNNSGQQDQSKVPRGKLQGNSFTTDARESTQASPSRSGKGKSRTTAKDVVQAAVAQREAALRAKGTQVEHGLEAKVGGDGQRVDEGGGENPTGKAQTKPNGKTGKLSAHEVRKRVTKKLEDILKAGSASLSSEPESPIKRQERESFARFLASKIESEVFKYGVGVNARYRSKVRSLIHNLQQPDNRVLRERVAAGTLLPADLVQMNSYKLASKSVKAARAEAVNSATKEVTRSREAGTLCTSSVCSQCGEKQVEFWLLSEQRQIGKSETWGNKDAPTSRTEFRCRNCGTGWFTAD